MRWQNVRGLLAVSVILVFLISGALPAAEMSWKAGIAKAKITPVKPVWMAGYAGRDHPAEGVLHDLWIKALALEAPDGHRAVIITSDLEAVPGTTSKRICGQLKRRCGLERRQIMITCSHTGADNVGLDVLLERFRCFETKFGLRFKPAAILAHKVQVGELGVKSGRGFRVYEAEVGKI